MSIERGGQFIPETTSPRVEIAQTERDLNEIIPILAHGLVRRIEQKGFAGKVRVSAMAGEDWGVAKSPDNPTDIPNVIVYPREYLAGDKRVVNARLRHEIGNLNYPVEGELNALRDWCKTRHIAPELLTVLVEATNEASVNYLEMQNSHSSQPEQNFRALYDQEIDTKKIADGIGESAPYKQAIDVTLLYTLSQTGLIPKEQFEHALGNVDRSVRNIFDRQTRSLLDQAIKIAVPRKKVQLIRDYLWPKFSQLVGLPPPSRGVMPDQEKEKEEKTDDDTPADTAQLEDIKEKFEQFAEQMETAGEQTDEPGSDSGQDGEGQGEGNGEDSGEGSGEGDEQGQGGQPGGQSGEMREGSGMPGGIESGAGGTPSTEQMKAFLAQMQDMLAEAKEQGSQGEMPGTGQEAIDQLIEQVAQMQEGLEAGAISQSLAGQLTEIIQKLSEITASAQGVKNDLENPDPKLIEELQNFEQIVGSKFTERDDEGVYSIAESSEDVSQIKEAEDEHEFDPSQIVGWRDAFGVKGESRGTRNIEFKGAQVIYGKPRGIEYEHLSNKETEERYIKYETEMREFIDDVVDFFKRKSYSDQDRRYAKNQRRGARLQRGWQGNIGGIKDRKAIIRPESLERRLPPEKTNFRWSIILDNSLSCGGKTFEQEKQFVVAMAEAARELDIPLEVVTFSGMDPKFYIHLKTFTEMDQQEFKSKLVKLKANQSTWDSEVLEAVVTGLQEENDGKEIRSFVFSLTDGFHSICVHCDGAGGCSDPYHPESDPHRPKKLTRDVIQQHSEDTVMMGIGFGDAAKLIKVTWGDNALEAPELDPRLFSEQFLKKVEEQADQTFD